MIRSQKLLDSAEGQACVNCGRQDGTVVAAHYQGMRSHLFGKGRGIKCHDIASAWLCGPCHEAFDGHGMGNHPDLYWRKIDQSEQFLALILQTIIRQIDQGMVKLP